MVSRPRTAQPLLLEGDSRQMKFLVNTAILLVAGIASTAFVFGAALALQEQGEENKEYTGEEIYRLFCIVCHGPRGGGSPLGANLLLEEFAGKSDDQIVTLISEGRPEKGMMSFGGSLSPAEIHGAMAYIRTLQGRNAQRLAKFRGSDGQANGSDEDIRKGEEVFKNKAGCMKCHSYFNQGGIIGPTLDKLSVRLSPKLIRAAVESPSKAIVEGYETKRIVLQNGTTLEGRFRKETADTVQLLNASGDLWTTYFKANLTSAETLKTSLMPSDILPKLTSGERSALYAFLENLK